MRNLTLIVLCAGAFVAAAVPAAGASSAPVRLSFDKTATSPGVWNGTVTGDIDGDLKTELLALDVSGPIWHVTFNWIVDAGSSSFTARLTGVLNTKTGGVVMDGNVVSGYLLGAQVHEEGQLVDPVAFSFSGSIRLMPATA
jgi:hypothetical protein